MRLLESHVEPDGMRDVHGVREVVVGLPGHQQLDVQSNACGLNVQQTMNSKHNN